MRWPGRSGTAACRRCSGRWSRRSSRCCRPARRRAGSGSCVPKTSVTVRESIQQSEPAGTSRRARYQSSPWMSRKSAKSSFARSRVSVRSAPKSVALDSKSHQRGLGMPRKRTWPGITLVIAGVPGGRRARGEVEGVPVEGRLGVRLGGERHAAGGDRRRVVEPSGIPGRWFAGREGAPGRLDPVDERGDRGQRGLPLRSRSTPAWRGALVAGFRRLGGLVERHAVGDAAGADRAEPRLARIGIRAAAAIG